MRLPSPDETFISVMDRLLGLPQGRGVPLPMAILPLPFLPVAGYAIALAAALMLSTVLPSAFARSGVVLIVVFFLSTLTSGLRGILEAKRRLRDARAWSPSVAARYRAEALRARETKAAERYALLAAGIVVVAVTFAILGDAGKTPAGSKLTLVAFGLAIAAAGRLAARYGECAMPRDPDATYRSPAPVGNA